MLKVYLVISFLVLSSVALGAEKFGEEFEVSDLKTLVKETKDDHEKFSLYISDRDVEQFLREADYAVHKRGIRK